MQLEPILTYLESAAPLHLAADWDNVGLLIGDRRSDVQRVMTCLTVTPDSAAEAVQAGAQLIVSHHPFPFHAMKRVTTDSTEGRLLLDLIGARIALYSPHTAFDSAREGINQWLAEGLGLRGVVPLIAQEDGQGTGRLGWLPEAETLDVLARRVAALLHVETLQVVGPSDQPIRTLGIACGAAGDLWKAAEQAGCDGFLVGETHFHTCLAAEARRMAMILPGHFASERFAVERLAERLAGQFPELTVWASRNERDPLRSITAGR